MRRDKEREERERERERVDLKIKQNLLPPTRKSSHFTRSMVASDATSKRAQSREPRANHKKEILNE